MPEKKLPLKLKILNLLLDGKPHNTYEIVDKVYGSSRFTLASVSQRITDLKNMGYNIPKAKKDKNNPSMYWYQLILPQKEVTEPTIPTVTSTNQANLFEGIPAEPKRNNWR